MLPVVVEIPYQSPSAIFTALSAEVSLCFLDSSRISDPLGRYSYLCFAPFLTIQSQGPVVQVTRYPEGRTILAEQSNPFDTLQAILQGYPSQSLPNLPPFQGGAAGYFGYDLLHHLEKIPLASSRVIDIPEFWVGLFDVVIAFDHVLKKTWVIAHGFCEENVSKRKAVAEQQIATVRKKISLSFIKDLDLNKSWITDPGIIPLMSKEAYCAAIRQTKEYILAGDIFQANITQCFKARLNADVLNHELYLALRKKNPAPFSAFIQFDDVAILSSSPERFIQSVDYDIETRPIKGTMRRSSDSLEDARLAAELTRSVKNQAENTMIVDLMRNDLSRVSEPGSVRVTQLCGLESFATVHHLVSVVKAKLKRDLNVVDLLRATFPGGSITGAPKIRAMEIIHELETVARGVYCGSIGFIGFDGNMDTSIVIRTITIKGRDLYYQAGGGIVADSSPEEEYQESLTKSRAIRSLLLGDYT